MLKSVVEQLKLAMKTGDVAGFIRALLVPLAYILGRLQAYFEQNDANERLREKYDEIENAPLTDDDVDDRLDSGTL